MTAKPETTETLHFQKLYSPISSPVVKVSELLSHPLFAVDLQNCIPECSGTASDPSGMTPQPYRRRTCKSGWQEIVPTWTQSADSVSCDVNHHRLLTLVTAKNLPLVPRLKTPSAFLATEFFGCKIIPVSDVHYSPKGLFVKTLQTIIYKVH